MADKIIRADRYPYEVFPVIAWVATGFAAWIVEDGARIVDGIPSNKAPTKLPVTVAKTAPHNRRNRTAKAVFSS